MMEGAVIANAFVLLTHIPHSKSLLDVVHLALNSMAISLPRDKS